MSVKADYERRTLDEMAVECLGILRPDAVMRCGNIGDQLFGHVAYMKGSAPFARIAGRVMKRMEQRGWAENGTKSRHDYGGWYLTIAGQREKRERGM